MKPGLKSIPPTLDRQITTGARTSTLACPRGGYRTAEVRKHELNWFNKGVAHASSRRHGAEDMEARLRGAGQCLATQLVCSRAADHALIAPVALLDGVDAVLSG